VADVKKHEADYTHPAPTLSEGNSNDQPGNESKVADLVKFLLEYSACFLGFRIAE
jgi:hypothetical protein